MHPPTLGGPQFGEPNSANRHASAIRQLSKAFEQFGHAGQNRVADRNNLR
jgi:hypothetical protein